MEDKKEILNKLAKKYGYETYSILILDAEDSVIEDFFLKAIDSCLAAKMEEIARLEQGVEQVLKRLKFFEEENERLKGDSCLAEGSASVDFDLLKKEMIKEIGTYNNSLVDSIASSCVKVYIKHLKRPLKIEGSASGWVKTSERLPEAIPALPQYLDMSEFVQVWVKDFGWGYGRYSHHRGEWFVSVPRKSGDLSNVVFWTPLPLPPGQLDKEDGRAIKTVTE